MVLTDEFIRVVTAVTVKDEEAKTAAIAMVNEWLSVLGRWSG